MIDRLERVFPYVLLATAILPLVVIHGMLYPYVAPKTILLRGLAVVALALFSYLALSGRSFFFSRLRNPITWIPGILLLIAFISTVMNADFYHGLWSNFDRGDGVLTLASVTVLYYLVLVYAGKQFFSQFLRVVAFTGSLVAIYACLQWVSITLGVSLSFVTVSSGRIGSTFGNAAFLAAYLGMTFFITLIVARQSQGVWKKIAYNGATFQIIGILITATRGTLVALIISGILALMYFALFTRDHFTVHARLVLVGIVTLVALFFVFRTEIVKVPIVSIQRMATISVSDSTVSSRLFVWSHVVPDAMRHPFLGTGAESIEVIFNRIYDPGKITEQWFDRSHNAFLDYFVQYGILGLLAYLALIGTIAYAGIRRYRQDNEKEGLLFVLLAFSYAISNFFVFDTAMTLMLMSMLAALVLYGKDVSNERKSSLKIFDSNITPSIVAVSILLVLFPVSITPLRANLFLADGYLYHILDVRRAVASMNEGLSLGTYADLEYGYQAYDMYTSRQQTMLTGEARIIAYQYAVNLLTKNYAKYPYDARTATYLGHVLDSAPPEVVRDEAFETLVLERAIQLSPKRAQAWYMLANIPLRKGDDPTMIDKNSFYHKAISVVEAYANMVPETSEPRYILATLYLTVGDTESAKHWADEALPLYSYDGSLATAKRAARYYVLTEDWLHAEKFLLNISKALPSDYGALYDFAKAAFLAGNEEIGIESATIVKQNALSIFNSDPQFVRAYDAWMAKHKTL